MISDTQTESIGSWFRANFVPDDHERASMSTSTLRTSYERYVGSKLVDITPADFEAALVEAGAVLDAKYASHGLIVVKVREVDELGIEYGGSSDPEPIEWLVDEILPTRAVGMFVAAPYELKTWGALSLAVAISQGKPWLGRFQTKKGRVIFLDYEMGLSEVRRRLRILNDDGSIGVTSFPTFDLTDQRFWEQLANHNPACVVIDSFSRAHPGIDEKDARYAEPLAQASRFAADYRTSFIFIHHSPKAGGKGLSDLIRGTSALAAALDVAFHFEQIDGGNDPKEKRAIVTCIKQRRGGSEPDPFKIRLTDEAGVELFEPVKKRDPEGLPEDLGAAILIAVDRLATEEGAEEIRVGYARIAKAVTKRTAEVAAECKKLLDSGTLVNNGTERKPDLERNTAA